MEKESWKVFLACAIGAGLGSLIALGINPYFWWVGLIVGFLAGYLSYEWRAVVQAIPRAYRAARGWRLEVPPLYWKNVGWNILATSLLLFYFCFLMTMLEVALGETEKENSFLFFIAIFYAVCVSLFSWVFMLEALSISFNSRKDDIELMRKVVSFLFPPILIFYHLPRGLYWLIPRLPQAIAVAGMGIARGAMVLVRFIRRFGYELFIRIHSEIRLLCGVDAMLGAVIGYFAGSALIGALAGGIFGLINYEVVSKRLLRLHLQPRS